jgi:hypothetical protein
LIVEPDAGGVRRPRIGVSRGKARPRRSGAGGQRDESAGRSVDRGRGDHHVVIGAQAIGDDGVSAAAWLAILCFIGVGFCVLAVLWPRRDWEFDLNPQRFIATYLEPEEREPLELWLIHRDLALHMGASADKNRRQLRVLMIAFRAGAILIILEVIGWVAALIDAT